MLDLAQLLKRRNHPGSQATASEARFVEHDRALIAMPSEQHREYDNFIALLYTSNSTLGVLFRSLTWIVDRLEHERDQYAMLGNAAALIERAFEETPDPNLVRKWHRLSNVSLPLFLRGLKRDVEADGLERLLILWRELRSLEVVWGEIAAECDGEDLRHPNLTAEVAVLRGRLLAMIVHLSPKDAKKPPEPDEATLASVRRHVDEAMRLMTLREPPE